MIMIGSAIGLFVFTVLLWMLFNFTTSISTKK